MEVNLSKYCCLCGEKIGFLWDKIQIGFRGKSGTTPANACGSCWHIHNHSKHRIISELRFIVTRKRFFGGNRGYYICAKPIDIKEEDWQDYDRCWIELERVYETRWDCCIVPEGVRLAT